VCDGGEKQSQIHHQPPPPLAQPPQPPPQFFSLQAIRRAALDLARLARSVDAEVPDTAAAVRLSGLEVADCIEELGAFGADLSAGARASARLASDAAGAAVAAPTAVAGLVAGSVMPALKARAPSARAAAEAGLRARAGLESPPGPTLRETAAAVRTGARVARAALHSAGLTRFAARSVSALMSVAEDQASRRPVPVADGYGSDDGGGGE